MSLEDFLDKLEKDEKAKKKLAEIITSDYDTRLALINAVLRDVATRQELVETKNELKSYIDEKISEVNVRIDGLGNSLNKRIDDVNKRVDDLNSLVRASLVAIVITLATTILVPLILKFLP